MQISLNRDVCENAYYDYQFYFLSVSLTINFCFYFIINLLFKLVYSNNFPSGLVYCHPRPHPAGFRQDGWSRHPSYGAGIYSPLLGLPPRLCGWRSPRRHLGPADASVADSRNYCCGHSGSTLVHNADLDGHIDLSSRRGHRGARLR